MMQKHRANRTLALADDVYLQPYREQLAARRRRVGAMERRLTGGHGSLADFASGHEFFGLHFQGNCWVIREWAPHAVAIFLIGDCTGWRELPEFRFERINAEQGFWELRLLPHLLTHGMHYRLRVHWHDGAGDRIPSYCRRVVQDPKTQIFSAQVWHPQQPYRWRHATPQLSDNAVLIYEAHVGMAIEEERVGTFGEFRRNILPRIAASGYDTVQLMAVMEHPYYGSFGYHVSSFFAVSSRFGTPEEFKELVDAAHGLGLRVIIDLIHSHAVRNEVEGLGSFDGTRYQYFHDGDRGVHRAWDSYCFNYGKPEVVHFLLSNCRFWLDEYHVDGFRFDGVTSMLYRHHGLGCAFTSYADYFTDEVDEEALTYLTLANRVIHAVRPDAVTVAEDVSGMPGLGAPEEQGGIGFDYRLAMGVTDYWFKLFDQPDEAWSMGGLWHELTNRRRDEKTISYVECHDQALVGGKTMAFRLMDAEMYYNMHAGSHNLVVDRGMALHKMARLATIAAAANGYLNFMGNEFGHPEWIDFPREDNGWSYQHARRLWYLADAPNLRYGGLARFDREMIGLFRRHELIARTVPQLLYRHDEQKILVFERGGFFFFFNFHPTRSFSDFPVETLPGEYVLELDTDAEPFGGFGRIASRQHYLTHAEIRQNHIHHCLQVYLPSRTALVLRRLPQK
ncbi:MAG: alpha-amylase family glycosyl hydrolase [Victivallales bacterium]|nr:alpha-amylase family glycosyl hydrolase [Victivallales bacterium]